MLSTATTSTPGGVVTLDLNGRFCDGIVDRLVMLGLNVVDLASKSCKFVSVKGVVELGRDVRRDHGSVIVHKTRCCARMRHLRLVCGHVRYGSS